jgi:phosphomannomutase / phosphoglucomutase
MSIYKECDIRGIYGKDFNDETAYLIGRAVGSRLNSKSIVVGGDVRESTPSLVKNLVEGLVQSGAQVIDLGRVPTPLMYFAKNLLKAGGGIMVTASHNPAEYNGFKLMIGDWPVRPKDIKNIEADIIAKNFIEKAGSIRTYSIEKEYIDFILPKVKSHRKFKVVIDACNGSMSEIAPKLFSQAGYEVIKLFCTFDGKFPNRNPNPAVYSNLTTLQTRVIAEKADLGIAFDGDGDRVVFVDNLGRYCESERSFVILIKEYLRNKKSSVVYDGKSSSVVKNCITGLGSRAILERSGHAFIKKTFLENSSELAGEISGHFFFKGLGYDDGLYASLIMAGILSGQKLMMSEIMDEIEKTVITPDLRVKIEKDSMVKLMNDLSDWEHKYPVSRLDGIRIVFPSGWILVRKSVTEPCITIRLEADNIENAEEISRTIFEKKYANIHRIILESLLQ